VGWYQAEIQREFGYDTADKCLYRSKDFCLTADERAFSLLLFRDILRKHGQQKTFWKSWTRPFPAIEAPRVGPPDSKRAFRALGCRPVVSSGGFQGGKK
jgi:hypothetical protein